MTSAAAPLCAVLFDYGKVLSLPADEFAMTHIRQLTGLSEAALHHSYWAHRDNYDRGTLTGTDYWRTIAREHSITLDDATLTSLLAADIDVWGGINQPMLDFAQRLQRRGIRTGILSNIGDAMEAGLRARYPWIAEFNHCTWSHNQRTIKPDAAIYRCAVEGLACEPGSVLFIDDKEKNVAGAIAAGLQAILYTTFEQFEAELRMRGLGSLLDDSPIG